MKKQSTTTHAVYNGMDTNNGKVNNACYTPILDKYQAHLEDMLQKHCKVMQVRFDLRYPTDGSVLPNPQHLHDFNYNIQRKLNREQH